MKCWILSSLQSSVSHDPSEIILIFWFSAQETVIIIISVENSCAGVYIYIYIKQNNNLLDCWLIKV